MIFYSEKLNQLIEVQVEINFFNGEIASLSSDEIRSREFRENDWIYIGLL